MFFELQFGWMFGIRTKNPNQGTHSQGYKKVVNSFNIAFV
jgi:hypothetical protein